MNPSLQTKFRNLIIDGFSTCSTRNIAIDLSTLQNMDYRIHKAIKIPITSRTNKYLKQQI